MRILFSICGYDVGGVATAFNVLARYLETLGHEVFVVLSNNRGMDDSLVDISDRYVRDWIPYARCPIPFMGRPWLWINCLTRWGLYFKQVKRLLSSLDYDVFVMYHGQDVIWRWFANKPSVFWFHEIASDSTILGAKKWRDILTTS